MEVHERESNRKNKNSAADIRKRQLLPYFCSQNFFTVVAVAFLCWTDTIVCIELLLNDN